MASRRKSSTPCMVPAQESLGLDQEMEELSDPWEPDSSEDAEAAAAEDAGAAEGGYECKYCSFQTAQLNLFTLHVDTEHPDVVLNTSYVCLECDYHTRSYDALQAHNARAHPGEDNFTRTMVKRNKETVVQQTVNDLTFDGSFIKEEEEGEEGEGEAPNRSIAFSKTPIMRVRSRPEPKRFRMAVDQLIKVESEDQEDREDQEDQEDQEDEEGEAPAPPAPSPGPGAPAVPCLVPVSTPLPLQSFVVSSPSVVQIKGGGGGGVLPAGTLAQVLAALQGQQSGAQTQLLIPVSSIPTYNSAMDNNLLLLSAYGRFPYPSLTEITGLSSQTKFSEEQIKVWFSAQRLKHGVSWTPEEVEEARRKKFNGTVQTAPPTITVIPAGIAANGLQPIFQTCQIVGQPGLVLTQVAGGASPLTLTVAGLPGNQPRAAEPAATESRTEMSAGAPPPPASDPSASKPKKSKEQLAELKASYGRRQFASEEEISRLMQVTRLSKRAIKKWFSDTRYNQRNSREHHAALLGASPTRRPAPGRGGRGGGGSAGGGGPDQANGQADGSAPIVIDSSDDASDASPRSAGAPASAGPSGDPRVKFRHAFPDFTPQKFKEKTAEQLLVLEASFQRSDTPSDEELSRLRAETKLTRREVDAWFTERRKACAATPPKDAEPEGEGPRTRAGSGAAAEGPATPPGGRKILKKTPEQLHALKKAFVRSQWPTADEYEQLAQDTGLPRTYVVNWFGDTRYACKNSNLKWFYLYQSGKVDEALNGGTKNQKKSRKRFRGWSRRTRRPYACKRSPQGGAGATAASAAIKVKAGREFLKDYFLKHGGLSERDLDELVAKSSMSYEQVRDWFSRTSRRAQEGQEPFGEEEPGGAAEPGAAGQAEGAEQQEEERRALSQSQAEEQT